MNNNNLRAMPRLLVPILAMATSFSCASRRPALPSADPASIGLSPAALARITPALQAYVDSGKLAGIVAVIARHGRIGYETSLGWSDLEHHERMERDAIFRIYSMTKPIVAAGALVLVDQGKLDLDDPVAKYIPAFANVKVFAGGSAAEPLLREPDAAMTVRQLLTHMSGLAYGLTRSPVDTIFLGAHMYDAARTLEQFTDSLAKIPLLFSPGTGWSYSSGIDVVGRVIEVASGEPLDRFLQHALFEPLGMKETSFRINHDNRDDIATLYARAPDGTLQEVHGGLQAMYEPDARFLWGSGGLLCSIDDYLRFAQMLLNGGELNGTRVLRRESVAMMMHNQLPASMTPLTGSPMMDGGYGFGLAGAVLVDSTRAKLPGPNGIYRWSGYVGTYFWIDPVNDLVAMVWTQFTPGRTDRLEHQFQTLVYDAVE